MHQKRPCFSHSQSSQSADPPDTHGVMNIANDVPALHAIDGMGGHSSNESPSLLSSDHFKVTEISPPDNSGSALAVTSGDDLRTVVLVSGTADRVPTTVHVADYFRDDVDSTQLSIPSTDTGLQVAALSPRCISIACDTDDDEDISQFLVGILRQLMQKM